MKLYQGAFLQMFGRGEGTVLWGDHLGQIEWTNFPPRRPDVVYLPDITGLIKLGGSDHPIMYRMQISLPSDDRDRRLFAGPVRWYTDDLDWLWLNDRWGCEEGVLNLETFGFRTVAYAIHPKSPKSAHNNDPERERTLPEAEQIATYRAARLSGMILCVTDPTAPG